MQIVILSYPETWGAPGEIATLWTPLEKLGAVTRHRTTTLPEFLERARAADVLVTTEFPLRRELLDYATRPRIVLVPADRIASLVELTIAKQLGIEVLGVPGNLDDPEYWVENAATLLAGNIRSADRQK
jgi:hypothetical protein